MNTRIISFNQYSELRQRGVQVHVLAIVWRYPEYREEPLNGALVERKSSSAKNKEPNMPESKLTQTIRRMLGQAGAHPGQPQRAALGHGLRIDVLCLGESTYLQLSRKGVHPSDREWETTMKHWPDHVPPVSPIRFERDGRYYLKAGWTKPVKVNKITSREVEHGTVTR